MISTVGGDLFEYLHEIIIPTEELNTIKFLIYIPVFNLVTTFMTTDMKEFHHNAPMDRYE